MMRRGRWRLSTGQRNLHNSVAASSVHSDRYTYTEPSVVGVERQALVWRIEALHYNVQLLLLLRINVKNLPV
jgi:hypothetical protein